MTYDVSNKMEESFENCNEKKLVYFV